MVTLTRAECESLLDFIEPELYNVIRRDTEIDGVQWLINICSIILPPSNGCIGNKLTIPNVKFMYIIIAYLFIKENIHANIMFDNGPAIATISFFSEHIVPFIIFVL